MSLSTFTNLVLFVLFCYYPVLCLVLPYREHKPCRGNGVVVLNHGGWRGPSVMVCRGCGGQGHALRLGARIIRAGILAARNRRERYDARQREQARDRDDD